MSTRRKPAPEPPPPPEPPTQIDVLILRWHRARLMGDWPQAAAIVKRMQEYTSRPEITRWDFRTGRDWK